MHQGKKTEISANQRGPWEGWFKHTKEDNYILYSSYKFLYTNTSEKPKGLSEMLAAAAAAKSLQSCPTPWNPIDSSPPGSPVPGFSRKNTGVGCHFLLQCMRVKSESEVAQSCPTLCDSMDYSLPGSTIHGISQATVLEWVAISFSNKFWRYVQFSKKW